MSGVADSTAPAGPIAAVPALRQGPLLQFELRY